MENGRLTPEDLVVNQTYVVREVLPTIAAGLHFVVGSRWIYKGLDHPRMTGYYTFLREEVRQQRHILHDDYVYMANGNSIACFGVVPKKSMLREWI